MPSSSFCRRTWFLVSSVALVGAFVVYTGFGHARTNITIVFPGASTPNTEASTQFQQSPVCAVNLRKDWIAQSGNQTLMTTNLLLACPSVVEILGSHQQRSFAWQVREYIDFHIQHQSEQRLEWIFFLKDHELLFSHSPRSLKKFLPPLPSEVNVLSFMHDSTQEALGLFAIRLDSWSVSLLDSVLQLLDQQPGLSDLEAVAAALASNNARKVAYIPHWWLEIRGNCVEQATWEAPFGVNHVVETDRLCCSSDSCHNSLSQHVEDSGTSGNQIIDAQGPLGADSEASFEQIIQHFWTRERRLEVPHDGPPVKTTGNTEARPAAAGER